MAANMERVGYSHVQGMSLPAFRETLRANRYDGHTAGLCPGLLQCNLVILPAEFAQDFQDFCDNNPVSCPLIAMSKVGEPNFASFDGAVDLRRDLPAYHLYRGGAFDRKLTDISAIWQKDWVAFGIGCSFSFEQALGAAGVVPRHILENKNVPMYRTHIAAKPAGAFSGPTVVSMRAIREQDLPEVIRICQDFPHAHGAPLHVGDPAEIGITDISSPDWGDATTILPGEVPAFWGCGVTTQVAIANAKPEFAVTHAPGAMVILNVDDTLVA